MEQNLNGRFSKIAKSFGRGLAGVLSGGGLIAAGTALVQKLLNPLREIQESIDKTLNHGSELATQAKQFGTTPGELAKLQAFGAAKGLDAQSINVLVEKFQSAVAEATADPNKNTSVRSFVGRKDSAQAFFEFIQGLQKLNPTQQNQVQQEVFGEKSILKTSEFLHSDFAALSEKFKNFDTDKLSAAIEKTNALADQNNLLGAQRNLGDITSKAKVLNGGVISSMNEAEQAKLKRENERIANFQGLISIDEKINAIMNNLEQLSTEILTNIPILLTGLNAAVDLLKESVKGWKLIFDAIKSSGIFRSLSTIKSLFGGDDK